MDKLKMMERIINVGIIAVVRADSPEEALKIADAVKKGGIEAVEITMTVPGADDVIKELKKAYSKGEILIGAGTVLDPETTRIAMLAGAEFFVSPYLN
jgi:2-dehydro-3-deoxyphosphogluconate aldolase/(4S)-4-hydroxy-2-oxoglutarate aldolase